MIVGILKVLGLEIISRISTDYIKNISRMKIKGGSGLKKWLGEMFDKWN